MRRYYSMRVSLIVRQMVESGDLIREEIKRKGAIRIGRVGV